MTKEPSSGISILVMGVLMSTACEQTLRTGKVGNTRNAPNPDGGCPTGLTVCGTAAFARCLDLQNDREHCGSCDNACLPGIACTSGTCQQVACTGPVTVSTQTTPTGSGSPPDDGILADINGDGRPDLVSWGIFDGKNLASVFQVALGEAGGGFAPPTTYQTSRIPTSIVAGDSNGDGFQDLYVVGLNESSCGVELWLGHADGNLTLASRGTEIAGCDDATVADLNGDGKLDLVADISNAGGPTVFLADDNGDFHVGTIGCSAGGTLVWDWNGDGFPDLVDLYPTLGMCLNRGNGTFDDVMDCGVATGSVQYVGPPEQVTVIGDFNRDGHPDLATAMDNSVDVLLGMGGCQFQPMMEYPLTDVVQVLASGDVNGDGLLDLVALTRDGTVSLLLGEPDGTFQVVPFSVGGTLGYQTGGSLVVADVTGDGKADIVFVPGRAPGLGSVGADGTITTAPAVGGGTEILENTCP
jgi:hypothetical protein